MDMCVSAKSPSLPHNSRQTTSGKRQKLVTEKMGVSRECVSEDSASRRRTAAKARAGCMSRLKQKEDVAPVAQPTAKLYADQAMRFPRPAEVYPISMAMPRTHCSR